MSDWRSQRDQALLALDREKRRETRIDAAHVLRDLAREQRQAASEFRSAIDRLLGDSEPEVRRAGLEVAGAVLPPEELEPMLVARLTDPLALIRITAIGTLADLERPLARGALASAANDEDFSARFEAARGLAALGSSAGLEALVNALERDHLRFRALGALANLGDPASLPAIQRLFHRLMLPPFERTQAAGAMAKLGDPEGGQHLLKRTRRKWSLDRAFAIELCGEVRVSGALERLLEILRDDADPYRGTAARGLGRLRDPRALEPMIHLFEEAGISEELRLDAAEGLCLLGIPQARARLESALAVCSSPSTREALEQLLEAYP